MLTERLSVETARSLLTKTMECTMTKAEHNKSRNPSERKPLTAERLWELLYYDPETGVFTWLTPCSRRMKAGDVAGSRYTAGYLAIRVDYDRYLSHRLVWLYVHSRWPAADIDHINGVRDDNRLSNLREATRSQNNMNSGIHRHNTSGIRGVSFDKANNKWMAHIMVAGRMRNLGRFLDKEDARAAYERAALEIFGEFTRLK